VRQSTDQCDTLRVDEDDNPHVRWGATVVERLEPEGLTTVIDAGCGTGRVTELLLRRVPGAKVIAVDGSRLKLAAAAARLAGAIAGGRVELVHADLTTPLPVEPADAILSTATFHWIADHDALFETLALALRPGGQLVAQCGGAGSMGGESWAGSTYFATPDDMAVRLQACGFVDVDTWLEHAPVPGSDYVRLNIVARRAA
jgi:trans-aconitate 2-methyltransferase